ncbi:MAG: hypothetical protein IKL80_04300, partial [Clostridia bacterium]|nr:hypothetical protein [Clostridia bacterium]
MKKIKWIVVTIVAVIFLLGILAFLYFYQDGGYQTVSLKGYTLLAPKDWEINEEENALLFKQQQAAEKGRFTLLYQEAEIGDIPALMGFSAEDLQIRESNQYAVKVNELRYRDNGRKILQYVFCDLPSAPPYQAVLTLIDVRETVAKRMLAGFVLPEIGSHAPEKPLPAPDEAFLENSAYMVWGEEENQVFQIKLLEKLLAAH